MIGDMPPPSPRSLAAAQALDAADPVNRAAAFALPAHVIYLVGHSLGPATHHALARIEQTASGDWAQGLVRAWNDAGWTELSARAGARIAPLIGAAPSEVAVTDSVSVNLFKMAAAALPLARTRRIVVGADEFPTDQYVAKSICDVLGLDVDTASPADGMAALETGGVVIKSLVDYRRGGLVDMARLEADARALGSVVVWDLSHATGAVAVNVKAAGAQLAVGCCYKYLNGGPGAPGFVYVAEDCVTRLRNPIAGWFGHAEPFAFADQYQPVAGAGRFAAGTPPILSLAALEASLAVFDGIAPAELAAKSRGLVALARARAADAGLKVATPAASGAHLALQHTHGYAIVRALAEVGVLADFRPPDTIRLGFSPLFVSYADAWTAMAYLAEIVRTERFRDVRFSGMAKVT
jgi:kynureninase